MKKDIDQIVAELDNIKFRLNIVEKTLAELNLGYNESDSTNDRITQILKRAKIRSLEMAKNMTIEEVWDYYDKSVLRLKLENKNKENGKGSN